MGYHWSKHWLNLLHHNDFPPLFVLIFKKLNYLGIDEMKFLFYIYYMNNKRKYDIGLEKLFSILVLL